MTSNTLFVSFAEIITLFPHLMQELSHQISRHHQTQPNIVLPIGEPITASRLKELNIRLNISQPSSFDRLDQSSSNWSEPIQPNRHMGSLFDSVQEQPIKVESSDSNDSFCFNESHGINESQDLDQSEKPETSHGHHMVTCLDGSGSHDPESTQQEPEHAGSNPQGFDQDIELSIMPMLGQDIQLKQEPLLQEDVNMYDNKLLLQYPIDSHNQKGRNIFHEPQISVEQLTSVWNVEKKRKRRKGRPPKSAKQANINTLELVSKKKKGKCIKVKGDTAKGLNTGSKSGAEKTVVQDPHGEIHLKGCSVKIERNGMDVEENIGEITDGSEEVNSRK